jgi:LPXTG-site transpeptidase (sortase) family protein
MKKHSKKIFIGSIILIFIVLITILTMLVTAFVKEYEKQQQLDFVYSQTSYDKIQENLENNSSLDDLYIKIDGNNILGVIEIDKINYQGLIYEGTSMDVLGKGIGHFTSSPILNGNVCLAGHNYSGIWEKLYTLEKGDTIKYTSVLGTGIYNVCDVRQIEETDMSVLENTQEDKLTLITCVKNVPSKRLCVQAIATDVD